MLFADSIFPRPATNFGPLDWAIVGVYLLVSLTIGLLVKRYSVSMTAYLGAGRKVGPWLGIATMTGTELGLITVMYSAQKGLTGGFAAFHMAVLAGLVTFVVGLTGFIVAPLRRMRVLTIPEFYERRFNRGTRVLGGVVLTLAGILNMGLFLKIGSMYIVGVTGLSAGGGPLMTVMTVLLLLVLAYTVMGGMVSVIITDYVQFVVLSVGLLLTTYVAVDRLGWNNIFETVYEVSGEKGFNPLLEGEFGPYYVAWMTIMGLVSCAVWPTAVARALAMESTQAVKRQFRWSSLAFVIRFIIPYFWGICALVYFSSGPASWKAHYITEAEPDAQLYAMPVFLGQLLPTGMIGLVSAAMIAAFMSTHDSYLLCWSSVITQDIVAPLAGQRLSDKARVFITRAMILLIGAFIWGWGLFYRGSDAIWDYMAITGAIYFTGAIPVLVGGIYWKRASSAGAIASLLAGCSALVGLQPIREALHLPLSSAQAGLSSVAATTIAFVVFSLVFPSRRQTAEDANPPEPPLD